MIAQLEAGLAWLGSGLVAGLPAAWQQHGRWPRRWLLVRAAGDDFQCVYHQRGEVPQEFELPAVMAGDARAAPLPAPVSKLAEEALLPVVLRLPDEQVLQKRIAFPRAAEKNLDRMVSYEIDRHTPFHAEDVYCGYALDTQSEDAAQLWVRLAVTPRSAVDTLLEKLKRAGLSVTMIDFESCTSAETGLNLLGNDRSAAAGRPYLLRAACVAALLLAVALIPVSGSYRIEQEIERLSALEQQRRKAVAEVHDLRERSSAVVHSSAFMREREVAYVNAVDVLRETTRLLPDHSWIHRLEIKRDKLSMQGESRDAASLPALLDASALFSEPRFSAPLTRNSATGAERFTLTANIVGGASG